MSSVAKPWSSGSTTAVTPTIARAWCIGIADPDQLQDTVDIFVGRADGAALERYQVLGMEQIETPLGAMEALHLARAGTARVEIWLAPRQGWLPVQLRATGPDGTVRTQVVKEIRRAPAP